MLQFQQIIYLVVVILIGLKFIASSIPLIALGGVGVGVGFIFASLVFSISRFPVNDLIDLLIR
jgi:hypothetical protein